LLLICLDFSSSVVSLNWLFFALSCAIFFAHSINFRCPLSMFLQRIMVLWRAIQCAAKQAIFASVAGRRSKPTAATPITNISARSRPAERHRRRLVSGVGSPSPRTWDSTSGSGAVARVRAWQIAHPEYFERQRTGRSLALQDPCVVQVVDSKRETAKQPEASDSALQDFMSVQPIVLIGLIAHFLNFTLQDDIANTTRIRQELGQDVTNGRGRDGFVKECDLFRPGTPGPGPVQLDRSPPGA
jgi:hypothetical protein